MRKKLKLNMRFNKDKVECAKSPSECKECKNKNQCEEVELFYYPYSKKDILECITNDERRK